MVETQVKVPVEAFHRRPQAPAPMDGVFIHPQKLPEGSFGQSALIVAPPGKPLASLKPVARKIADEGFPVLLMNTRESGAKKLKIMVEDVQSGVTFLKSIKDAQIGKIVVVSFGETAEGAYHYANASKQMSFLLDGLMLINPIGVPDAAKIPGIPLLLMRGKDDKNTIEKQILDFVKKPYK